MARHLRWTALLFLGALCIGSPFELPFGGADIVLGSVYDLVTLDDRASLDPPTLGRYARSKSPWSAQLWHSARSSAMSCPNSPPMVKQVLMGASAHAVI